MTTLGRYEVLDEVGRGRVATVYRARDPDLDRVVALKVLAPHLTWDPTFTQRFRLEAQAMANLDHPNIVVIYEIGEDGERLYIAMAYLPGGTLAEVLEEEGALPLERALPILEQVASALDYAHGEGVLHRDVKPGNMMVRETPQGDLWLTLMDFGLVKAMESSVGLTSMGTIPGSPEYMAPEQADPGRADEIGPATDLYALGVVAYEMLVGRVPFPGSTPSTLVAQMQKPPPDPQSLREDLPDDTAQVLRKALSKRGEDRYATADELVQALRASAGAGEHAPQREKVLPSLHRPRQDADLESDLHAPTPRLPFEPDLVTVPAGPFLMGSDKAKDGQALDRELPQHEVELPAFEIGRYPVTNAEYAAFVEATGHDAPEHWPEGALPEELVNHPVVNVSWYDAQAYTAWLRGQTGRAYRLPTEAEWEKAARGEDGRLWPWGNEWNSGRCNSAEAGPGSTTPVGQYSPAGDSPYGCADMAGNVWEWCQSLRQPYLYQVDDGREGLEKDGPRVLRGGSWLFNQSRARCAARGYSPPVSRFNLSGFRVVMSPGLPRSDS